MRLRIELDQEVVQGARHRTLAGRKFMELGIVEQEVALSHRAFHFTMEWHIMQPRPACASGRCTISLMGVSMQSAVEDRGIVAAAAPFGGLRADDSCMYSIDFRYHWLLNDENDGRSYTTGCRHPRGSACTIPIP